MVPVWDSCSTKKYNVLDDKSFPANQGSFIYADFTEKNVTKSFRGVIVANGFHQLKKEKAILLVQVI